MSDAAIRAALDAARVGMCLSISDAEPCHAPCLLCREGAAAAVAAFLRALPHSKGKGWQELWNTGDLAAAVEKEARDAG